MKGSKKFFLLSALLPERPEDLDVAAWVCLFPLVCKRIFPVLCERSSGGVSWQEETLRVHSLIIFFLGDTEVSFWVVAEQDEVSPWPLPHLCSASLKNQSSGKMLYPLCHRLWHLTDLCVGWGGRHGACLQTKASGEELWAVERLRVRVPGPVADAKLCRGTSSAGPWELVLGPQQCTSVVEDDIVQNGG